MGSFDRSRDRIENIAGSKKRHPTDCGGNSWPMMMITIRCPPVWFGLRDCAQAELYGNVSQSTPQIFTQRCRLAARRWSGKFEEAWQQLRCFRAPGEEPG